MLESKQSPITKFKTGAASGPVQFFALSDLKIVTLLGIWTFEFGICPGVTLYRLYTVDPAGWVCPSRDCVAHHYQSAYLHSNRSGREVS
jgi:hypothetical protein